MPCCGARAHAQGKKSQAFCLMQGLCAPAHEGPASNTLPKRKPRRAIHGRVCAGSLGSPLVFLSGVTGSLWDVYVVLARSICSTRSSPSTKNIKCNNRKGANKSSRNTPESTVVLHGLWVSDIFYWSPRTLSALGDSRWNLTDSLAGIFFFCLSCDEN